MESLKNQITYLSSQSQWAATAGIHNQVYPHQTQTPLPYSVQHPGTWWGGALTLNPDLEAPGRGLDTGVRAAQEGSLS